MCLLILLCLQYIVAVVQCRWCCCPLVSDCRYRCFCSQLDAVVTSTPPSRSRCLSASRHALRVHSIGGWSRGRKGSMDPTEEKNGKTVDIYRDTWVRFLGYANEVGEAFRALVPVSLVWGSYAVATAYVTADAVDKGKKAAVAHGDNPGRTTRVAVAVVDTFVWQALASVIIPGFTINRVCAASLYLLGRTTKWPLAARKWTTTAIGLSTIPFIITPIDRSVDFLLDSSLRKVYNEGEKHE